MAKKESFFIKADNVIHNGLFFHSKLELKFALLIEDYCAYMREPITINYRKKTLIPTEYYGEGCTRYIPDFLVRKWKNSEATLIEIKNSNSRNRKDVKEKQKAAEKFIEIKNKDWNYKIIDETEIKLNSEKQSKYLEILSDYDETKSKIIYLKHLYKFDPIKRKNITQRRIPLFNIHELNDSEYQRFLIKGIIPQNFK